MHRHPDNGSAFEAMARTVILEASFAINAQSEEPDRITSHYDRLERLLQIFINLIHTNLEDINIQEWIDTIRRVQHDITEYLERLQDREYLVGDDDAVQPYAIVPNLERIDTGGRPKFSLPWEIITLYRNINYSWSEIAYRLNISVKTLRRCRLRDNFLDSNPYSTISDEELDRIVSHVIDQTAGVIGSTYMCSLLQTEYGLRLPRERIRQSMRRVDHMGNLNRWAGIMIPRLIYNVRAPNALWHMDGNLKFIYYGIALHAAIDGYSRRIIYLDANTNNRQDTVLNAFRRGVQSIGAMPHRVRADKGKENIAVCRHVLTINGVNRGSFITGRSVHNQRIERLWREVNRWTSVYHLIFDHLRDEELYDPDNQIDKFSHLYVYIPILQRTLSRFSRVWNNHKLRTEHYRTPLQLYADGNPGAFWMPDSDEELQEYGIDWDGPVPQDDEEDVNFEPPENPLEDEDWVQLNQLYAEVLHPRVETSENYLMSPHHNYGVDLYLNVREWIMLKVRSYFPDDDIDQE